MPNHQAVWRIGKIMGEDKTIDEEVFDEISGTREITSKVVIDFGNGVSRTVPEIEVIRKIVDKRRGTKTKSLNTPQ